MNSIIIKINELTTFLKKTVEYIEFNNAISELKKDISVYKKIMLYESFKNHLNINEKNILTKTQLLYKLDIDYKEYLLLPEVIQYFDAKKEFDKLEYRILSYISKSIREKIK